MTREAGILLHITSLPSAHGIGDLGKNAYKWVDFLSDTGLGLWQVLPLTPPDASFSPYKCLSAFGGNPLLIAVDLLEEKGLLTEITPFEQGDEKRVDFPAVLQHKARLFRQAFDHFRRKSPPPDYQDFVEKNHFWLSDFCFFMALREHFNELPWTRWDRPLAFREPEAMKAYRRQLQEEIAYHQFLQYLFETQWQQLKAYATKKGVRLIGDLPIFVAHDSTDVWSHPHLFRLDEQGEPTVVAGVPPDIFSETGQRWGNPHYNWARMEEQQFGWWVDRVVRLHTLTDIIRIDHFIGLEAAWEIPAGKETAAEGRWVKSPGEKLFQAIQSKKNIPLIAEDLGLMTAEAEALKNKLGLPGMKILQFAFEGHNRWEDRPGGFPRHSVVYTGTHDNNTVLGWFRELEEKGRFDLLHRLEQDFCVFDSLTDQGLCRRMLEILLNTQGDYALFPLQDLLNEGKEGRMNIPGTATGNWGWRFQWQQLTAEMAAWLEDLVRAAGRCLVKESR